MKLWLACNRTDEAKQNEERIQAIAAANSTIQAARENIEYYESSLKMMAEAVAQEMAQVVANQRDLDPNWLGGMLGLMLKVPHIVQKETAKIESEKKEMEDLLKQIERAASKL